MSDDLHGYLATARTPWHQHVRTGAVQYGTGWHFCFPRQKITPGMYMPFYGWGMFLTTRTGPSLVIPSSDTKFARSHFYPNTEQFVGGFALPQMPLELSDASTFTSASAFFTPSTEAIACTKGGRLYVWNTTGQVRSNLWLNPVFNTLGLGPENQEDIRRYSQITVGGAGDFRQLRVQRDWPTIVYGQNADLESVHFARVCAGSGVITRRYPSGVDQAACFLALSDTGQIWMTGGVRAIALPSEFSENSAALVWFRETLDYTYETPAGEQTDSDPLEFAEIRFSGNVLRALTKDGRIFHCGEKLYAPGTFVVVSVNSDETSNLQEFSTVFREITGFIDTIELTNGGLDYEDPVVIILQTYDDADINTGVVFQETLDDGQITAIAITSSGYGYTNPITVDIQPAAGGPGSGATATATAFDRAWLFLAKGTGDAAICEDDVLYQLPCENGIRLTATPTSFQFLQEVRRVPNQNALGYLQVATGFNFGIALVADGSIETWGVANRTPTLSAQYELTPLSQSGTFVSVGTGSDFAFALRDDGKVFTYGGNVGGQCGRGPTVGGFDSEPAMAWGQVPGDAVWSEVFAGSFAMLANRSGEQFDELGNRLNPLAVWPG